MTKAEIDSKMEDIIEFAEVRDFIDTPVKRYSSGMYVKLAFSVAAHLDSEIMIMDEVLAVGDMAFQKKCLDKMRDVANKEGRTVLYVSHNMNTIRQLCDRCIVLSEGQVVYDGEVEDAIRRYLDITMIDDSFIDFTKIPRLDWLVNTKIRTLSARYLKKNGISFVSKEKAELRLEWINEANVESVSLRIEFLDLERRPIGTSFIYDFYDGAIGEKNTADFEIDLSLFAAGKYTTNYIFFRSNFAGNSENYDCVHGLNIEIIDGDNISWDEKSWGRIKMPITRLISINCEE